MNRHYYNKIERQFNRLVFDFDMKYPNLIIDGDWRRFAEEGILTAFNRDGCSEKKFNIRYFNKFKFYNTDNTKLNKSIGWILKNFNKAYE